jgi:OOP family OmpA-OmpF porin
MDLSRQRAESVRQYFIQGGIDGRSILAIGLGAADPIADNSTKEGREENRRVVLRILRP